MTAYEMATAELKKAEIQEQGIFKPKELTNYWKGFRDGLRTANFEREVKPTTTEEMVATLEKYVKQMNKIAEELDKEIDALYDLKHNMEKHP